MLRFYPFIDEAFSSMGDTEGNQHRLTRDMQYLLKKSLSVEGTKGMPQGGGGIMTLQRGYASQLLKYLNGNAKSLPEVIASFEAQSIEARSRSMGKSSSALSSTETDLYFWPDARRYFICK